MARVAVAGINSSVVTVNINDVHTNIIKLKYRHPSLSIADFALRLRTVKDDDPVKVSVVAVARRGFDYIRLVTHWEITDEDTDLAIQKILYVAKEFEKLVGSKL